MRTPRLLLLIFASAALACSSPALAATYYVDSVAGSDGNPGTSPEQAWQSLDKVNAESFGPGDQILLKAGSAWNGQQLRPRGSGSAAEPIVVNMYDTGNKPQINCEGAYLNAVYLYNIEYWELNNLDITNTAPSPMANQHGVFVQADGTGTLHHIHLKDLDVHDVNGHLTEGDDQAKNNGGIIVDSRGALRSSFDDVLIEGCSVINVDKSGIKTWSAWPRCKGQTWEPHINVVIRDNVLDDIAGDGIVTAHCDGALVEYNVASRCHMYPNGAYVAMWTWDCANCVFQYNEAYDTRHTSDGQAWDIDAFCNNITFQYNYSHDNHGGFMLLVSCEFCTDNVVRYNISQNDMFRLLRVHGPVTNTSVYNNVFYIGPQAGNPTIIDHTGSGQNGIYYRNNIFYNMGNGGYDYSGSNVVFDYNVFYGNHPSSEPPDAHKLTSDPKFVAPGTASVGRDTCAGYKLQPDSPCIDSGMTIPDGGGRDFWGNPVPFGPATDRAAHEYRPLDTPTLLEAHPN